MTFESIENNIKLNHKLYKKTVSYVCVTNSFLATIDKG